MIASKLHNDIYVKKVDNITSLFKWDNVLKQDFPQLPNEAIVINDVLIQTPLGLNNEAYTHHALTSRKFQKIYCSFTVHDYDEDAPGMFVRLAISDNNGTTWSFQDIMPKMSNTNIYGIYPAQWTYPSQFLDLPSGFYLFINAVDGIVGNDYQPLGSLVRKINSDNTLGEILWVNNGIDINSRITPTPISGYPSYNWASESLIDETITYLSNPMLRPKILFGINEIWSVQENYIVGGTPLKEPTEIKPYNYNEVLKVWKTSSYPYNIVQNGENNSTQIISELPNVLGGPARRFYNYSPEIIISVGQSQKPNREELMLFIARKNNETGVYHISNDDVYSVTPNTKNNPVYSGWQKFGGEQLVHINRVGKDGLDITFAVSKEQIYFKSINVSPLI